MEFDKFLALSDNEVAQILNKQGASSCVFVLNGTRRWFLLEHQLDQNISQSEYFDIITLRLIELCKMFYDHGISTLILPIITQFLLEKRGSEYTDMVIQSLGELTYGDSYREFYADYDVRVKFYGDVQAVGSAKVAQPLQEKFDDISHATSSNRKNRLFWGVCAHESTQAISELAIEYFKETGRSPNKADLINMYYGEPLSEIDLFISSSKVQAFDLPLISSGHEDLYFTVAPSPYLNKTGLRKILHDHIFNRQATHIQYQTQEPDYNWNTLRDFYHANQENILGVGTHSNQWGIWHPTPQLTPTQRVAKIAAQEDEIE